MTHPASPTRNPFEEILVLLNGAPLDLRAPSTDLRAGWTYVYSQGGSKYALYLDVVFHLVESAQDSEVNLEA